MSKIGLVLEGGSLRGIYSAGVLDIMMDNNIEIDTIVGTSAGALFGPNYFSKQRGRAIRYNKRFCKLQWELERNCCLAAKQKMLSS